MLAVGDPSLGKQGQGWVPRNWSKNPTWSQFGARRRGYVDLPSLDPSVTVTENPVVIRPNRELIDGISPFRRRPHDHREP
jgi:hypothetical protein